MPSNKWQLDRFCTDVSGKLQCSVPSYLRDTPPLVYLARGNAQKVNGITNEVYSCLHNTVNGGDYEYIIPEGGWNFSMRLGDFLFRMQAKLCDADRLLVDIEMQDTRRAVCLPLLDTLETGFNIPLSAQLLDATRYPKNPT